MEYSPRVKWVADHVSGERILDIGFVGKSSPLVHGEIRRANSHALVVGLDTNLAAMRQHRFSNVVAGNGSRLPYENGCFDAVALLEVIEHVYDSFSIIEEARRVLRSGGYLYLTTPNTYALTRVVLNWMRPAGLHNRENYRGYLGDADHKIFWEPLSLINALADRGLEVVAITTKNHRIPILARFIKRLRCVDLSFYPMNRLGAYICIVARAV